MVSSRSRSLGIQQEKKCSVTKRPHWVNSSPSEGYQPNGRFGAYSGHSAANFRGTISEYLFSPIADVQITRK